MKTDMEAKNREDASIYFFDLTPDPLESMLFGLALDDVGGGTALFGLPISIDDLLVCFFVFGSPLGGVAFRGGGGGACFFAELQLLFGVKAWTCCLQLACAGVQTMPLMMTPRRIVSLLTLSLLSGLSSLKGSIGFGLVTLLGGVGLTTLAGGFGGCGGGCGTGACVGLMTVKAGEMGRVVISSTVSSMT